MLLDLSVALLMLRLFGKVGLYTVIVVSIIVCNIQVMKLVELFGLTATLGNILYASIFFSTDVLGELYGKKEAKRGVWLGFTALVVTMVYMQIALRFHPAPGDFAQPALERIFDFLPRVVLASICAYLLSQFHDVWAFHFWKGVTNERHLWLRNNLSTAVSQFLDSFIFITIAFYGTMPVLPLIIGQWIIKFAIGVLDTPVIYAVVWFLRKKESQVIQGDSLSA